MESFVEDYAFFAIFGFAILMVVIKFFGYSYFAFTNGYSLNEFMFGREEELSFANDVPTKKSKLSQFNADRMLAFLLEQNILSPKYDWSTICSEINVDCKTEFASFITALDEYVFLETEKGNFDVDQTGHPFPGFATIHMKTEETEDSYYDAISELVRISGGRIPVKWLRVRLWFAKSAEREFGRVQFLLGFKIYVWRFEVIGKWLHYDVFRRFGELLWRRSKAQWCLVCLFPDQVARIFIIPVECTAPFKALAGECSESISMLASLDVDGPLQSRDF